MPTQRKSASPTKQTTSSGKAKSPATPFSRVHPTTRKVSPSVPARPTTNRIKPGMSPRRDEQRIARRTGARQAAERLQTQRPRPNTRPVNKPVKVMANTPPPLVNRSRLKPKPGRVNAASPRKTKTTTRRVAGATAGAAAAAFLVLNTAAAPDELSAEIASLQSSLKRIQSEAEFDDLAADVSEMETLLQRVIDLLESARDKGYHYQSDLETLAYQAASDWEKASPQVSQSIERASREMDRELKNLDSQVQRLNANIYSAKAAENHLRATKTKANSLLSKQADKSRRIESKYSDIKSQLYVLEARLTDIHWAMEQLDESQFDIETDEDLIMAVPARWDKEGKDDPEGILFLTNQDLVFERKEKVATKKVLFITTSSELIQEVLLEQPLSAVKSYRAESKGLFGHQDFLSIEFSEKQLGSVSLHLDGQDSKIWAELIKQAKSGAIEDERMTGSAGVTLSDLTKPLTKADLMSLQAEVNSLQDETMLKDVHDELAKLENQLGSLERQLTELRNRGYNLEKGLEVDIQILSTQWERIRQNTEGTISLQTALLSKQMESVKLDLARVMGMSSNLETARSPYMQLRSKIASLEAQADSAEVTVYTQYDEYADEVEAIAAHLEWVAWMQTALETASFRLLATENAIAAVEALFVHPDREPENGILFLTDQRLLWEDRVDAYELKIDLPLQEVLDIAQNTEGDGEALQFSFGPSGPVPRAIFELSQPVAEEWMVMVGRARAGGYIQDQVVEVSAEELERIRNAPQQCSNCGAAFTAPILRGQREIACEYCSIVERI